MSDNKTLKNVSAVVATISFVADLIAVVLFIRNLLFEDLTNPGFIFGQVAIVLLIFGLAVGLANYAGGRLPGGLFTLFGWLYVILGALFLARIAYLFLRFGGYTFWEWLGYLALVALVTVLGVLVCVLTDSKASNYFAIPFMVVALEQIVIWVYQIFAQDAVLRFNWTGLGNLLLFVVTGLFIVAAISVGDLSIGD